MRIRVGDIEISAIDARIIGAFQAVVKLYGEFGFGFRVPKPAKKRSKKAQIRDGILIGFLEGLPSS